MRRRLLWQIYPSYVVVILLSILAVGWHASRVLRDFNEEQTRRMLERQARVIDRQTAPGFRKMQPDALNDLVRDLSNRSSVRITIIDDQGVVLADSDENPGHMDNHAGRPEFRKALAGTPGESMRLSPTLERNMLYYAVPLHKDGRIVGALRTSVLVSDVENTTQRLFASTLLGGSVVALFAAALGFGISIRLSRMLDELRRGAERFASGELNHKIPVSGATEIAALAKAMNDMAAQMNDRISTVVRQHSEQQAVFASMIEGVIALDADERVLNLNDAAARFLEAQPGKVRGRHVEEAFRNPDLNAFVQRTLGKETTVEEELQLGRVERRQIQAHGTTLRDANGRAIGALVVLNDITRLRRLETVRSDFVANVSHELRTPITSIKGFVETLLEGARDDPESLERFLRIIDRHADRLNAIIEDLLALSRLEEGGRASGVVFEEQSIARILEAAVQSCATRAASRDIQVTTDCPAKLRVRLSPVLLEQAIVNLVDNAIKYSPPGSRVWVEAGSPESREEIRVSVRDEGNGIPEEHLPRIFERFYRVDKARSRSLGGTGLGLAIVKHVAQMHGGSVEVESEVGKGSVFTIRLPRRKRLTED